MKKGIFCISIDTELLWGRRAGNYKTFIEKVNKERDIIERMLGLFKKYNIAATWAVVGHLFLKECFLKNGIKHPEIVRFIYPEIHDWFDADPVSSIDKDSQWYGEDLVEILQKSPNQEIGSHSFSHICFGHPGCSEKCAESEIKACINLAKKKKIKLSSFVYPYNSIGHIGILKKYDFITYRGKEPYWFPLNGVLGKIFMAIDLFLPTSPPVSNPYYVGGLINIPGSYYFLSERGIRRFIPKNLRFQKAKKGIDKAIKDKKVFHLWTHPIDFADNTDKLLEEFTLIIQYADKKRREEKLAINTMRQIAKNYGKI